MYGAVITDTVQGPKKSNCCTDTLYLTVITETILHLPTKPPQTCNKAVLFLSLYYIIKLAW